jgi:hypothetical protein
MKNKAYHNVGQFPKFNQIIAEAEAKSITPSTNTWPFTFLAWYMQSTKGGGVTLVLWMGSLDVNTAKPVLCDLPMEPWNMVT